jgi:hypothetical protein
MYRAKKMYNNEQDHHHHQDHEDQSQHVDHHVATIQPLSDIYSNIIIIQLKYSTYNVFRIFK